MDDTRTTRLDSHRNGRKSKPTDVHEYNNVCDAIKTTYTLNAACSKSAMNATK